VIILGPDSSLNIKTVHYSKALSSLILSLIYSNSLSNYSDFEVSYKNLNSAASSEDPSAYLAAIASAVSSSSIS
jgi:hypothetical protein